MKAKLIKRYNGEFYLRHTEGEITSHHELSLKNCQAIERGYDLDELAERHHKLAYIQAYNPDIAPYVEADYKAGFQKALEILGDRKFTEEDVRKAMDMITHIEEWDGDRAFGSKYTEDEIIQSLQQNEWEVEILDERDSEGRLILKRVV